MTGEVLLIITETFNGCFTIIEREKQDSSDPKWCHSRFLPFPYDRATLGTH